MTHASRVSGCEALPPERCSDHDRKRRRCGGHEPSGHRILLPIGIVENRLGPGSRKRPGQSDVQVLSRGHYPLTLTSCAISAGPVRDRSLTMPIPGP
jgi:hypothetical protein